MFQPLNERKEKVRFIVGIDTLHNAGHPFQTHTGIDIFAREFGIFASLKSRFCIVLAENNIPDFDVTIVVDIVGQHANAEIFGVKTRSPIVEYFRTRSARPFPDFPEIAFERNQVVGSYSQFDPQISCLIIGRIIGHVKFVFFKTEPLVGKQDFAGPGKSFLPEIIPNGEISQHFEKRMVPGCPSDIVDIVGPNGLLNMVMRGLVGFSRPSKYFFKGAIPAFIHNNVGSSYGTRGALGMIA